jgi:hypothetical protein
VQYFIQAIAGAGGADQIGPVLEMFCCASIIVGAYMHVLWTGLTGIGFAYYVTRHDEPHQQTAVGCDRPVRARPWPPTPSGTRRC